MQNSSITLVSGASMTENSTVGGENTFSRFTLAVIVCIMASSAGIIVINIYHDYTVFPLFHSPAEGSSNISARGSNNSRPMKMLPDMLTDTTKFDPKSCISRYESLKYRKPSPHSPSSYLISKVREYENLHAQCGPNTESYKAAMKELSKYRNHTNFSSSCKYVVWKPANGLGNKMLSLTSAFLYGLLTDRVLLLKNNKDAMNRLYCEPFPNSTWLLPEDFRQIIHGDNNGKINENIPTFTNLMKSSSTMDEHLRPLIVHLDIRYSWGEANIDIFHCDSSQEFLHGVPALIIESDQYFVPSLYMMSTFQEELSKLFPEKDAIFNLLGNYLFQPSNEAWETITAYYQTNLEHADQKVGLQIRVFQPQQTANKTILSEILSCTREHNLLPKIETNTNTTGRWSLNSKSRSVVSKAILVASLYSIYGESLKDIYRNSSNDSGQVIEVYQPSHEEHQVYGNQEHDFKAWVEIYLLSLCDVLVTSWGSTFGYVAHSLGAEKPWILDNFNEAQNISNPSCRRALSMEPCFHYPPKLECGTNTTSINITALFPYMRPCEDDRGVKLVSSIK